MDVGKFASINQVNTVFKRIALIFAVTKGNKNDNTRSPLCFSNS